MPLCHKPRPNCFSPEAQHMCICCCPAAEGGSFRPSTSCPFSWVLCFELLIHQTGIRTLTFLGKSSKSQLVLKIQIYYFIQTTEKGISFLKTLLWDRSEAPAAAQDCLTGCSACWARSQGLAYGNASAPCPQPVLPSRQAASKNCILRTGDKEKMPCNTEGAS